MDLWVVGKVIDYETMQWEFAGVFDDQQFAEGQCHSEDYFVAPIELNFIVPIETTIWPGGYYPTRS